MDIKKVSSDHRFDVPVRQKVSMKNKQSNDTITTSPVHVEDMTSSPVTQTDNKDRHLSLNTIIKHLTGSIGERSKVTSAESKDDQTKINTDIHATDSYIHSNIVLLQAAIISFNLPKTKLSLKRKIFPRCVCVCVSACVHV